ncbi:MAG: NifU family protein [Nocardioidaceae bacterium]
MADAQVVMHPEAVAGDPTAVRWVVASPGLPFVGAAAAVPDALARLLADATLASVVLEAGSVLTVLGSPAPGWRVAGPDVRTALHEALLDPDGWVAAGDDPVAEPVDLVVARVVREALAGDAGDFVRSHGGDVELVEVCDGVVSLRLSGSCVGCPALGFTVGRRLEGRLRRACPLVREVRAVA